MEILSDCRNVFFGVTRNAVGVTLLAALAACNLYTVDVQQQILVKFNGAENKLHGIEVGLFEARGCMGPSQTTFIDAAGEAKFSLMAHRGRFAVALERISLCKKTSEHWQLLWTESIDPPDKLILICDTHSCRKQ